MINPMDLSAKRILLTGASSGIGKAAAIHLSRLGANLQLVARNEDKLNETLKALDGSGHKIYPFDLNNIEGIEELVRNIVLENKALNGMVHCAGIADMRPLQMTKYDFIHKMFIINFFSFIELVRVFSKRDNYIENASIVGISSVAGSNGIKSKVAYCSSKSAIDGAIRSLSVELAVKKIRVNSIIPGFIKTEIYDQYIKNAGNEAFEKNVLTRQYSGIGETQDTSNAIAFLLSDASKFITGTGLIVDGGYLS